MRLFLQLGVHNVGVKYIHGIPCMGEYKTFIRQYGWIAKFQFCMSPAPVLNVTSLMSLARSAWASFEVETYFLPTNMAKLEFYL